MKAKIRELSAIEADLTRVQKRTIADIIETGRLLIEARQHVGGHGKWLPWLKSMAISDSTARRHMGAAEFAENRHVTILENLSATALYYLAAMNAEDKDDRAVIEAALREAETSRVNQERILDIEEELEVNKSDGDGEADDTEGDDEGVGGGDEAPSEANPAREKAEAILDGPSPDLPPTEGPPSGGQPAFPAQLSDFDSAVSDLLRLSTKPAKKFSDTTHSANNLRKVAEFVAHIAGLREEDPAPAEKQDDAAGDADDEVPAHLKRAPIPSEPIDSDEPPRPNPGLAKPPPRPRLKERAP